MDGRCEGAPRVEVVVLGTAQDGGLPHAGCRCERCERARQDIGFRRHPASLGIIDGDLSAQIDATSAFANQLHLLRSFGNAQSARYPGPDRIVITHAHTGHYVGLWQLDRSVMAAGNVPVLAPPKTASFLASNEPWVGMIRDGFINVKAVEWNSPTCITPQVTIEPIEVPHRSEWPTDTACLLITGPSRTMLYLPDIDRWDEWDRDISEIAASVDVALLDGCFWGAPTSPNVPHPPILETIERLCPVIESSGTEIYFTHLNHTNPAVDPESDEARYVREHGFQIASEGTRLEL